MKAQPVRTDFNLTDTGQLQIAASWQRAANLRLTPLRVNIAWQKGQLGQITMLLTGKDRGWRGGVDFAASMVGTPEALAIESRAAIQGFRRYDIVDSRNVRLATHCAGYSLASPEYMTDLPCESPPAVAWSSSAGISAQDYAAQLRLDAGGKKGPGRFARRTGT